MNAQTTKKGVSTNSNISAKKKLRSNARKDPRTNTQISQIANTMAISETTASPIHMPLLKLDVVVEIVFDVVIFNIQCSDSNTLFV